MEVSAAVTKMARSLCEEFTHGPLLVFVIYELFYRTLGLLSVLVCGFNVDFGVFVVVGQPDSGFVVFV